MACFIFKVGFSSILNILLTQKFSGLQLTLKRPEFRETYELHKQKRNFSY